MKFLSFTAVCYSLLVSDAVSWVSREAPGQDSPQVQMMACVCVQAVYGKCNEAWMLGYCAAACHRCSHPFSTTPETGAPALAPQGSQGLSDDAPDQRGAPLVPNAAPAGAPAPEAQHVSNGSIMSGGVEVATLHTPLGMETTLAAGGQGSRRLL